MSLFHQLTEKPWVTGQRRLDDRHGGSAFSLPAATLGLRVFMAVITVLFTILVVAYAERMSAASEAGPVATPRAGFRVCPAPTSSRFP